MRPGLSALVVHDLKNRLAVHAQRLAELAAAQPALADAIAPLCDDADALQRRLVAFLTLYRSDVHGLAADDREEDPAHVLAQAAAFGRSRVAGTAVTVEVDASRAPAEWFFDAWLVGLALEAAVDNAARYARSRIRLAAAVDGDRLVLSVEDDGPGLDDEDAVCRAASASPSDPAAPGRGAVLTGLGTELCATVARLHVCDGRSGELRLVDRTAAGEGLPGTRFELRLP
ncbi:MAG: hypothetical protein RJA99_356 [Pseudomonadota bacterium]|jgi:K+-sensing histidine kinase KdpD